jgi:hypothetical protein
MYGNGFLSQIMHRDVIRDRARLTEKYGQQHDRLVLTVK